MKCTECNGTGELLIKDFTFPPENITVVEYNPNGIVYQWEVTHGGNPVYRGNSSNKALEIYDKYCKEKILN
jgi:hypothetical protein